MLIMYHAVYTKQLTVGAQLPVYHRERERYRSCWGVHIGTLAYLLLVTLLTKNAITCT
jgi:hypothetical protein